MDPSGDSARSAAPSAPIATPSAIRVGAPGGYRRSPAARSCPKLETKPVDICCRWRRRFPDCEYAGEHTHHCDCAERSNDWYWGRRLLRKGSSRFRQRVTPPEISETTIVAISGDELTPRFNCQCGEPRIGNQIPSRARIATESFKDLPMPSTRLDCHSVRLLAKRVREAECSIYRSRRMEYAWVCHDPEKPAQNMIGYGVGFVRLHQAVEPLQMHGMFPGVIPEGINKDVHINESQAVTPPSGGAAPRCRRDRRLEVVRSR